MTQHDPPTENLQGSNSSNHEKSQVLFNHEAKNWPTISTYVACTLMTSIVVVIVAIAFGIGSFGLIHPHIFTALFDQGFRQLYRANQLYEAGNLSTAIALADAIPPESPAYDDAQAVVTQWQTEWTQIQNALDTISTAQDQEDWATVLATAKQLPTSEFWRSQRTQFIEQAQIALDQHGRSLLQKAFSAAYQRDFVTALAHLQQISPQSEVYGQVPAKIAEYTRHRNIRAQYYLQQAFNLAQERNFHEALDYLRQIDAQTPVYHMAQAKILEYIEKRDLRAQYLMHWATHRATLEDYDGAILLLQQVSVESPGYADAQVQILFYGQQLNVSSGPDKSESAAKSPAATTAPLPAEPPQSVAPASKPTSLNPGDRLVEVVPNPNPQP